MELNTPDAYILTMPHETEAKAPTPSSSSGSHVPPMTDKQAPSERCARCGHPVAEHPIIRYNRVGGDEWPHMVCEKSGPPVTPYKGTPMRQVGEDPYEWEPAT